MKTSWFVVMILLSMLLVTWSAVMWWWVYADAKGGLGAGLGFLWVLWLIYIFWARDD